MAASTSRLVIEISSEQAKRNAELLNRELQSIEKNGDFATKSMDAMSVATRSLAAQMTALVSVGALISKMDAYTNLQNRLKLVTNSQTELNKAMSDTFDIAQRTRQSWDAAAQVYQGFANNAKTLGLTMDQTAKLTETVSKAVAISGASAASAEAALVQFNQALGAGALRGEELNSVMEQTPALARAIAEGMGITVGQLRTVAATGAITSEALVKALEKASKSVDSLFAKTDPTIGQSFTMLNNEVSKFIGEAGKASGAASLTADSVKLLAENLDLVISSLQVAGAYYVGTYIPAIYASVAAGAAKSKQLVEQTVVQYGLIQAEKAAAAQELANVSAKLASTEGTLAALQAERALEIQRLKAQISAQGLAASQSRLAGISQVEAQVKKELIALTAAQTAAQERLNVVQGASLGVGRGLLGLLGGPAGLAGIAVAVGTSMLLMRDNTSSATDAFDLQKQSVADLADTYSKLTSAKLVSEMDETAKKLVKAKDQIDDARSKLLGMVQGSQDYIDDRTIQQQKIMLDVLEQIKTGSIDAAKALQTLQASKAFDKNEIQQARNYFANLEEGEAVVAALTAKQQLANSALNKASGLYENLEGKARGLSEEQAQLSKELETSKTNFDFISKALLQTAQNSGVSKDGMNELKVAINQYAEDSLKATELLKLFQRYIPISNNDIETYSRLAIRVEAQKEAYARNKKELEGVNKQQAEFIKNSPNAIKGINDITEARNKEAEATRAAQKALDSYRSSALNDIKEMSARLTLMKQGLSDNQIDYLMKALKALNYDPKLTGTDEAKQLFNLALQQAKLADTEDKIAESRKESTKQLQKQYEYTKAQQKLLAKANSDVSKSGLGAYAESKGIPASYIAGLYMQESKAGTDLKSHTGALGNWQTTSGYRKDNGISLSDNNDFLKVGKIVVDNIAKEFEKSGSLEQAILSHNAGAGGARQFMKNGTVAGDPARQKEVSEYFSKISKWAAWSSGGKISNDQRFDFDDFLEKRRKNQEEINKMRDELASEDIQRLNAHNKKIADITKNFTGQERDKYIMQENQRYDASNALAKAQFEMQANGWQWVGEQRILKQAEIEKLAIQTSQKYGEVEKQIQKDKIDEQAKYEIDVFKRTQQAKLDVLNLANTTELAQAKQKLMYYSMDQSQRQGYSLSSEETTAYNANDQNLLNKNKSYEEDLKNRLITQQTYDKLIEDAVRVHEENKAAIQAEYSEKFTSLQNSQYQSQLQIWGNLLSQGQTTWSQLTQSVKDASGEQSTAYKVALAAQQAFSIASTLVSTHLAAAQVLADPTALTLAQKTTYSSLILGFGYAQAGLIAAQTIAGFSTGGHVRGSGTETSDSIPAMLSDNEYVIKAKSVRSLGVDTLDYINRMGELPVKRASGGSVGDTSSYIVDRYKSDSGFKVTINNYGNDEVQTSQDADGNLMVTIGKMLDQKIDSGVDRGIQRNLRQGYPLHNAIKGK